MTEDPGTKVTSHSYILDTKKLLENLKIFIILLRLCVHMWVLHLNVSAPGVRSFGFLWRSYGWILGLALVLCKNSILSHLSSPHINAFE